MPAPPAVMMAIFMVEPEAVEFPVISLRPSSAAFLFYRTATVTVCGKVPQRRIPAKDKDVGESARNIRIWLSIWTIADIVLAHLTFGPLEYVKIFHAV
jgi:hypothetical protein